MFKYNNAGKFVNENVNYLFNIENKEGIFIDDFWREISKLINQINNEELSKIRYMWIDAGNYCQTEIFLKNILEKKHGEYPVLYLHWIDYINKGKSVYHQISQEQINNSYFINNSNVIKICVIDHAEIIEQKDQYLELCKKLHENRCIFIFVAKKDVPSIAYWEEIVKKASCESEDDSYLGILRSEENYYIVKPYSIVQCKEIFLEAILQEKVKVKVLSMAETLGEELRRPYYFDFLIKEINNYKDYTQIPEKLDDSNLMLKIFHNALEGIIAHLKGYVTLKEYLDGYYDSTFVKNYSYGEHSRIPFDNYAWAYGIMHCIGKSNYADTIAMQFNYLNSVYDLDFKSQLEEINERIVQLFYSEKRDTINKYFLLEKYFLHIIDYSLEGSRICSIVLNKCLKKN